MTWLVAHKIKPECLTATSYGATVPYDNTDTGRQLSRRTEFKIVSCLRREVSIRLSNLPQKSRPPAKEGTPKPKWPSTNPGFPAQRICLYQPVAGWLAPELYPGAGASRVSASSSNEAHINKSCSRNSSSREKTNFWWAIGPGSTRHRACWSAWRRACCSYKPPMVARHSGSSGRFRHSATLPKYRCRQQP